MLTSRKVLLPKPSLQERIEAHQSTLEEAREELKVYLEQHPEPIRGDRQETEVLEIDRLQFAISQAEKDLVDSRQKEQDAQLATDQAESDVRQTYLVIDGATLPTKPESSKKDALVSALIFVVVGVILSVGGIIGAALLDRSFRFPIDVRHGLDLPVLALIPDTSRASKPWWRFWQKG